MTDWFATRVRIARPTDRLDKVIEFYRDGIGLPVIGKFDDHDGYDGIIFGMPDTSYQLEFTQHNEGSPGDAPSRDNLTVFYFDDESKLQEIVSRLGDMGDEDVPPETPYWIGISITIADTDGWHVGLFCMSVFQS